MSSELHLQEKFLLPFFVSNLGYNEVKANTVNASSLIIEEDLEAFISGTELNRAPYQALLKKFKNDKSKLLTDLIALIQERAASNRNMALFFNNNKTVTFEGVKLHLFYPSGSEFHENKYFQENIFSVVQELSYKYRYSSSTIYTFRPDITLFLNGIYLGYSELKYNLTNQSARKNGRAKVIKDYFDAYVSTTKHSIITQCFRNVKRKATEKSFSRYLNGQSISALPM
jgi:type I restriction enzyme R subunit